MLTIIIVGGSAFFLYSFLKTKVDQSSIIIANSNRFENEIVLASTKGIKDIIIYNQQSTFLKKLNDCLSQTVTSKIFILLANSAPSTILEVLGFAMIPLTIYLLSISNISLEFILSAVMLLVLTAWRVLPYLNRAVGHMMAIRSLRPMALSVLDFLSELKKNKINLEDKHNNIIKFSKQIDIVNADFTYPDAKVKSLDDVSLTILKGAFIGIVGPSGAGKSTICNILSGLCYLDDGKFLVDGFELKPYDITLFRKRISFVPQSPFLIAGSLAENIAFSQWGQSWDEERIISVCKQASIDFITLDSQGIRYKIGENGSGLSGGQIQRIAIARALYSNPDIIIFDEATSSLDAGNENFIVSSIEKLRNDITCVIIAHRLSTVENCDIIYWMDNGKIIKSGPPTDILPMYLAYLNTHIK